MPEQIVDILNAITAAKGAEFTEGFVAGVNLTTPEKKEAEANSQPG
jgi:hypothetical protein